MVFSAELNGYPGPKHELELTADQVRRTREVRREMSEEARRLGGLLVETERSLDRAFRERTIDGEKLEALTARSTSLRGGLRADHLSAHLRMTNILTPHQRHRFQRLRGYAEGQGHGHQGQGDGHHSSNGSEQAPAATEPGGFPGAAAGFTGRSNPPDETPSHP